MLDPELGEAYCCRSLSLLVVSQPSPPPGFNATKVHFRGSAVFGPQAVEDPSASQSGPGPQVLLVHTRNLMILGTIYIP